MNITVVTDSRMANQCHIDAISASAIRNDHTAIDIVISPLELHKHVDCDLIILVGVDIYHEALVKGLTDNWKIPYGMFIPYIYPDDTLFTSVAANAKLLITSSLQHNIGLHHAPNIPKVMFGPIVSPHAVYIQDKSNLNSISKYISVTPADDPEGVDMCKEYVEYQECEMSTMPYPLGLAGRSVMYSKHIKAIHIPSRIDYLGTYAIEALLYGCELYTTDKCAPCTQRPILSSCKHNSYKMIGFEEYTFYRIYTTREKLSNTLARIQTAFWKTVEEIICPAL
jgi:hypothetical protein